MTISLAMIVKNEAMRLARCLESVAGLVDEMVVVDTGSDDDSREVARANGANVVEFPWCDDFAAARNVALGHATGDWVLKLDADEAIESGWHEGLRSLTGEDALAPCWLLRIVNLMDDRPPVAHHGSRLFRRLPEIRYGGRVHENRSTSPCALPASPRRPPTRPSRTTAMLHPPRGSAMRAATSLCTKPSLQTVSSPRPSGTLCAPQPHRSRGVTWRVDIRAPGIRLSEFRAHRGSACVAWTPRTRRSRCPQAWAGSSRTATLPSGNSGGTTFRCPYPTRHAWCQVR